MKNLRQQFTAASKKGDLAAQVQVAREQAIELLNRDGLDAEEEFRHITELAGDFNKDGGADAWQQQCRQLKAAYALGIAVGQLVHPDVFAKGRAR